MNITNSLISAFSFLNTLESLIKNDIDNDPSLAIGKFDFNRILNFDQQYVICHLSFTDDETHTNQQLATITIQCTSHQEDQYAFKGSISFPSIKKEYPFTVIIDSQLKIKSLSLKLSMYFKSFLVETLGDKVLKDDAISAPRKPEINSIDEEAEKLLEIERKKKERTIQMNPLDLQKELFEEAIVEEKQAEPKSNISPEDSHQPLEMSADEIEKMLLGGDDSPPPSPPPNNNQPLEMSADEIEKMLLGGNEAPSTDTSTEHTVSTEIATPTEPSPAAMSSQI